MIRMWRGGTCFMVCVAGMLLLGVNRMPGEGCVFVDQCRPFFFFNFRFGFTYNSCWNIWNLRLFLELLIIVCCRLLTWYNFYFAASYQFRSVITQFFHCSPDTCILRCGSAGAGAIFEGWVTSKCMVSMIILFEINFQINKYSFHIINVRIGLRLTTYVLDVIIFWQIKLIYMIISFLFVWRQTLSLVDLVVELNYGKLTNV